MSRNHENRASNPNLSENLLFKRQKDIELYSVLKNIQEMKTHLIVIKTNEKKKKNIFLLIRPEFQ